MDSMTDRAIPRIEEARRLIIKIGSSLIVDPATAEVRTDWLSGFSRDVAGLKSRSIEVVVVSSGAISIGRRSLGLARSVLSLEQKQAAAAVGQIQLAHAWKQAFGDHDMTVAQILLTLDDTEQRRRHLNARATINTLLTLGVVPIINENDSVTTEEIRYGDNDRLAARVAQMISADILVLLSDVNGLYTADPRSDSGATLVPVVDQVTSEILDMAGKAPPGYSSGGMITKLEAARISLAGGCAMVIAYGDRPDALEQLESGTECTWFIPPSEPLAARKRWIAGLMTVPGSVTIDDGAVRALQRGKSLLPAGIVDISGMFARGDLVLVKDAHDTVIARGLSAYSADDARKIIGRKSRDIESILGYRGWDELIHRDDLVMESRRV